LQIRVTLFATLTKFTPGKESGVPLVLEIAEGSTLSDLIGLLNIPEKEVKLTFVNGRFQEAEYKFKDNDQVGIFPPIGGG